ncbi:MAG: C-type lectin domain-containing protein [Gemmatimonadota bacterium]
MVASVGDTALRDVAPPMIRPGAGPEPGSYANVLPDTTCPPALQGRVRRCVQWTMGNGHWYAVLDQKLYYEQAAPAVAGLPALTGASARLASLTSPAELTFVTGTVLANLAQPTPSDAPLDAYWLGATAPEDAGNDPGAWRWMSGELWSYTAWAPGEPNNANETALSIWGAFSGRPTGTWNNLLPRNMAGNPLHRIWSLVEWETEPNPDVCEVPVTNYKQTDDRWKGLRLDSRRAAKDTIGSIGCVLTSLAITFTHAGQPVDPPTLNSALVTGGGFTPEGTLVHGDAANVFSGGALRFVKLAAIEGQLDPLRSKQEAARMVCEGVPGIATVKNFTGSRGPHSVVITGAPRVVTESTTWRDFVISDPGYRGRRDSLARYAIERPVWVRGYMQRSSVPSPAPQQIRGGDAESDAALALLADSLPMTVVVGGGTGLLTDALGRRVGRLDPTAAVLAEIPGAGFDPYLEQGELTDTLGGNNAPERTSVSITLFASGTATFTLDVRAINSGPMTLGFDFGTHPARRRNVFIWQGIAGQSYRFVMLADPSPSARLIIQRTDAGAPRPYQLTALCGTRFRVRNRSDYHVTATWDVYGTAERGTLSLPPRPSGAEFSETIFSTVARGTVRLFVSGNQVDVKAPSAGACAN